MHSWLQQRELGDTVLLTSLFQDQAFKISYQSIHYDKHRSVLVRFILSTDELLLSMCFLTARVLCYFTSVQMVVCWAGLLPHVYSLCVCVCVRVCVCVCVCVCVSSYSSHFYTLILFCQSVAKSSAGTSSVIRERSGMPTENQFSISGFYLVCIYCPVS